VRSGVRSGVRVVLIVRSVLIRRGWYFITIKIKIVVVRLVVSNRVPSTPPRSPLLLY